MFEELETKKTPEEKKLLALEVLVAIVICGAIGAGLYFFIYSGY